MKIMGHRGARDRAIENTMRSFKAAIDAGVSAIEFDIHQTVDGVWVIHHDETLDRITKTPGNIIDKTWGELSLLKTEEGDLLPRLEELLDLIKNTTIELQVELKSHGDLKKLGEILGGYLENDRFTVISFNHRWLKEIKQLYPAYKTGCLLYGLPINAVDVVKAADANGISLNVSWIDEQLIVDCHQAGYKVTAWNANDQSCFLKMHKWGVDYLATDTPFDAIQWYAALVPSRFSL